MSGDWTNESHSGAMLYITRDGDLHDTNIIGPRGYAFRLLRQGSNGSNYIYRAVLPDA